MGHGHAHGAADHGRPTPERALWVALLLNAAFLVLEAGVGFWTNSLALLSDAGHMLSDVSALAIALGAFRLSQRTPDATYSYGLRRAPVLGALANAASLVVIVVFIGIEAAERFSAPPQLDPGAIAATGFAGLFVNLVSAWYLARSRDESVNTRGAMLHLLADALGSVAAIIAALSVYLWDARLADPIASLIIGILILVGTWPLLRDTIRILLQGTPSSVRLEDAKAALLEDAAVASVEDLHLWGLDSGQLVLSAVVFLNDADSQSLSESNAIVDGLRTMLRHRFHIAHATIEARHKALPSGDLEH